MHDDQDQDLIFPWQDDSCLCGFTNMRGNEYLRRRARAPQAKLAVTGRKRALERVSRRTVAERAKEETRGHVREMFDLLGRSRDERFVGFAPLVLFLPIMVNSIIQLDFASPDSRILPR